MNNWNIILKDFAHKCGKDGPDMTNSNHLAWLRESLLKFGWKEFATNEFIGNLRNGKEVIVEKRKAGDVWQTSKGWAGLKPGEDKARYGMSSKEKADDYVLGVEGENEEELSDERKAELRENDRRNVQNAVRRDEDEELSDEDAGMGTAESQAQEGVVVEGAMVAKDAWDAEFGDDPEKWNKLSWKEKKKWLKKTLEPLSTELDEICKRRGTALSCKNKKASFNTLERLLIKDDKKNPSGIGIENIEEIAWDTPDGQELVGATEHKTAADMFVKTKDGKLAGVSLKESGAVFWINKGYAKEFVKLTDKMEKDMTDECKGKKDEKKCIEEAVELVNKIRESGSIEHHQRRKAEREQKTAAKVVDKDSTEHKTYAQGVKHVHSLIKQAQSVCDLDPRSDDCKNLKAQLKRITGQTSIEKHIKFLEQSLGHREAWLDEDEIDVHTLMTTNSKTSQSELVEREESVKQLEQKAKESGNKKDIEKAKRERVKLEKAKKNNYGQRQSDNSEGDAELMSTDDHKATFRIFQNYDNPEWTDEEREAHHEQYDEQRKLDAKLTKSMYEALDSPEAKEQFKKWFLKSSHLLSSLGILGDEESDTYDSFQVLYGDEGEEDGLSGIIQDRKTLLALFGDDGTMEADLDELDKLDKKDPDYAKKKREIEQRITDTLLEKIEIDYDTGTIFIKFPDGNRPLVTLKARSRGTNASPTLEMGTTGYFQKVLKNGGEADPNKWSPSDRTTYSNQLLDIYDSRDDAIADTDPQRAEKLISNNQKRINVLKWKIKALEELEKLTPAKQKDLDETKAKLVKAEKRQKELESKQGVGV